MNNGKIKRFFSKYKEEIKMTGVALFLCGLIYYVNEYKYDGRPMKNLKEAFKKDFPRQKINPATQYNMQKGR